MSSVAHQRSDVLHAPHYFGSGQHEQQVVIATDAAQNDIANAQRRWIDWNDGAELAGLDAPAH